MIYNISVWTADHSNWCYSPPLPGSWLPGASPGRPGVRDHLQ